MRVQAFEPPERCVKVVSSAGKTGAFRRALCAPGVRGNDRADYLRAAAVDVLAAA